MAADQVARRIVRRQRLIGVAAHAFVAAGEEALRRRQVVEAGHQHRALLDASDQAQAAAQRVDAAQPDQALDEIGVGQRGPGAAVQVQKGEPAALGEDRVVDLGGAERDAGSEQLAGFAGLVLQVVFVAGVGQVVTLLPVAVLLVVGGAQRPQVFVDALEILFQALAGEADRIARRMPDRNAVFGDGGADVLRGLQGDAQLVAFIVEPAEFDGGQRARSGVGAVAAAELVDPRLLGSGVDHHRDAPVGAGLALLRLHFHQLEIVQVGQGELGLQHLARIEGLARHDLDVAAQHAVLELAILLDRHLAEIPARSGIERQQHLGAVAVHIDAQLAAAEHGVEIAAAVGGLHQARLQRLVVLVLEALAGFQARLGDDFLQRRVVLALAGDEDVDLADVGFRPGIDLVGHGPVRLLAFQFRADHRVVPAERLQRLADVFLALLGQPLHLRRVVLELVGGLAGVHPLGVIEDAQLGKSVVLLVRTEAAHAHVDAGERRGAHAQGAAKQEKAGLEHALE